MSINVDTPYGLITAPDADLAFVLLELLAHEAADSAHTDADLLEAVTMDLV